MRTAKIVVVSVVLAGALVGVVDFMVSYWFGVAGSPAHPSAIVTWTIFAVLVTAAGRALPRPAVLLAASILTVAALIGWASEDPGPVGTGHPWASSYFVWIAAGVLFTQGLWGPPRKYLSR